MILLIPTNDGINISTDFDKATSFRFLKVINGVIKEDQLMDSSERSEEDLPLIQERVFKNSYKRYNSDPEMQQIVITREISKASETSLLNLNFKVFHSGEINIINAIIKCLKDYATLESDYCCCP
jgi:heme oxygenase